MLLETSSEHTLIAYVGATKDCRMWQCPFHMLAPLDTTTCWYENSNQCLQATSGMINLCRNTKTQVNPSSALKRPKHHQSDQSIVPGILGSNFPQGANVHASKSPTIFTNRIPSPDRIRFPTGSPRAFGFYSPHRFN